MWHPGPEPIQIGGQQQCPGTPPHLPVRGCGHYITVSGMVSGIVLLKHVHSTDAHSMYLGLLENLFGFLQRYTLNSSTE